MIQALALVVLALVCFYVALRKGLSNVARHRHYKSGSTWAFFRWTDVDSEYILRLHVVKTPWGAICLHWIRKPDAEPWLHDHPVSFLSIILRGGYSEERYTPKQGYHHRVHRWFNFIRASKADQHRINFCRSNTLTLCLMGPKTREWGFRVCAAIEPSMWLYWKDYYVRLRAGEDVRSTPLARFERLLGTHYTVERVETGVGAPAGVMLDEDVRELDTADPADFDAEEITAEYGR
jgi:hypothetical protein